MRFKTGERHQEWRWCPYFRWRKGIWLRRGPPKSSWEFEIHKTYTTTRAILSSYHVRHNLQSCIISLAQWCWMLSVCLHHSFRC